MTITFIERDGHHLATIPNVRRMVVPDPGYILVEFDLAGADARTVAWEANDEPLKQAFRDGLPIHAFNAQTLWPERLTHIPLPEIKINPRFYKDYWRAKQCCHAVNYACKARTLAEHIAGTTAEAQRFIDNWFDKHPGILDWHRRIERQLRTRRYAENKFGYRRHYFDRVDNLLPEALAWIGQSTTAIAVNKMIVQIDDEIGDKFKFLLQTHDSGTGQVKEDQWDDVLIVLRKLCHITVPYDDPMPMPASLSASHISWGHLKEFK